MTVLVGLNMEAPTGSAAPTLHSLSSRCRSQSCDLAPVWMDGVAWTCGSESSGRRPCILTWSLNHSTHISIVHHQQGWRVTLDVLSKKDPWVGFFLLECSQDPISEADLETQGATAWASS